MPTAQLTTLTASALGCTNTGGIARVWIAEAKYISAIATTSDAISGFTMTTTGKWFKWEPSMDDTANWVEAFNRNGSRRTYTQTLFMRYAGIDVATKKAQIDAAMTCDVVAIVIMNDGAKYVQGLEIDSSATSGFKLSAIERTLIQPGTNSDVASGTARIEFTVNGTANLPASPTTITESALAAL